MQIGIHKVEHQIYVSIVLSSDHILQSDYIFMPGQLLQENDFPESTLGIRGVLECIKVLLESHDILGLLIDGLPHDTICALAYRN